MKIKLNNYLKFDSYFEDILQKAGNKLSAFSGLTNHMELAKRKLQINSLFKAQCHYCSTVSLCIKQY